MAKRNPEDPTVAGFLTAFATAYKNCIVYDKEKLPLLNSISKAFAALGPCMILSKKDSVMKYLIELPDLVLSALKRKSSCMKFRRGS